MVISLIIEVDVPEDISIENPELLELLAEMEDCAAKRNFSIYDQRIEED